VNKNSPFLALAAFALALMATCSACLGTLSNPSPYGRTAFEQRAMRVGILATCPAVKGAWGGTGVIVSPTEILTAAHVVKCPDAVIVVQQEGKPPRHVRVDRIDIDVDLAKLVLMPGMPEFDSAQVLVASVRDYQTVCAAVVLPVAEYRCGEVDNAEWSDYEVAFNAPVESGNSGSGLYDARGRLVGIVTRKRELKGGQSAGGIATTLDGRGWL
jgi:S1-C subfamily serine protease